MSETSANPPSRARITLTGISTRAWEHPADRGALVALRKLRGFDALLKGFNGLFSERGNRLALLKGNLKGYCSIRINDQWRIVFRWIDNGAEDVQIIDYH